MNCVAHQSPGLWRHPADRSWDYNTLDYWVELARLLETGGFDGLFIADVLAYDVYAGTDEAAIRQGAQIPVNDPLLLVSAMAHATEHLGFGITTGTGFEHPYPFARRLSTLDHLTKGRIGWNVVTGYLPSAARNVGDDDQLAHDDRYDHADEYLTVLYKLWEGSWERDAVLRDRTSGVFADPSKVHHVGHRGKHFTVPGIHLSEPSPQGSPVIYQAGASPRGRRFAAQNAEAIFVAAPTKQILRDTVAKIRDELVLAGRDPYDARIYTLLTIITDATPEAARAKAAEYQRLASDEGSLVFMSGWMGIDLASYDLDEPIGNVASNAIQSAVAAFQQASDTGEQWRVRDIAAWGGIGGMGPVLIGSGDEVAGALLDWAADTDVDGFNLAYAVTPGTFSDVITHVVPALERRGAYEREYVPGTLRNKLFGRGDLLPDNHRGASYRVGGTGSTIDDSVRDVAARVDAVGATPS